MVAYSFQKRFAEPILAGTKCQTIRAHRIRRHARPGEVLQLYTGMRTKHCQLIGTRTCTGVRIITLGLSAMAVFDHRAVDTIRAPDDLNAFAVKDGFANWMDMRRFWNVEHPGITEFTGVLIEWAPEK